MPSSVKKAFPGVRGEAGDSPGGTIQYIAEGYETATAAIAALRASGLLPDTLEGAPLGNIAFEEAPTATLATWHLTAQYPQLMAVGTARWSMTFSAGRILQRVSKQTIMRRPTTTAPDFKGGVNVTEDGPQGVEIYTPQCEILCETAKSAADMSAAYQKLVKKCFARWNHAPFRGFAAGEVLFTGAELIQRGTSPNAPWDCRFKFEVNDNVDDRTIALSSGPVSITCKGWDYVWTYGAKIEDSTAKTVVVRPVAAYAERFYDPEDFSVLALPGG